MFFCLEKYNNFLDYFFLNFKSLSLYLSEFSLALLILFPHFQQVRGTALARRKRARVAKFWVRQWGQVNTLFIVRYSLLVARC
jgi:hypothetical protein